MNENREGNTPCPELLLVDDDAALCSVLARALTRRGFAVTCAHDVTSALTAAQMSAPQYAIVDLKMPGASGLTLVERLREWLPEIRIVVLTGYASIATAVEAIKLGAVYYLAKPADVEAILRAFSHTHGNIALPIAAQRYSPDKLEWEYIQQVLHDHHGNISATARALHMHRRTLQRKLLKRPVQE